MLLSGGIDSATALYLVRAGYRVRALTFDYSGIARRELLSAKAIAARAEVIDHRVVRLPDLKEAGDIGGPQFEGLPPTYIPLRNGIFYSFAASYAEETAASVIVGGHNKDDSAVFADVSQGFFGAVQKALRLGSSILQKRDMRIIRPLSGRDKVEVVKLAASLGVPLELTWSCHRTGKTHCWDCDGCRYRRASFSRAGVRDPLLPHG